MECDVCERRRWDAEAGGEAEEEIVGRRGAEVHIVGKEELK